MQLDLAMTTVQFNYARRRLDILELLPKPMILASQSMSVARIGRRKQVKLAK